jgi:N-acetylneuraminic acid mutarotase
VVTMNGSTRRLGRGVLTVALAIAAAFGPATGALAAPAAARHTVPATRPTVSAARHTVPATPATHDTRRVCGKPKPGYAACMSIVRTNVRGHLGLLAAGQTPAGFGPADLQSAYKLPSATAGAGKTVAIVDAYDDPRAESDLAVYRKQYGLPPCTTANGCFRKVAQDGSTHYPTLDLSWSLEISLDLDMVSAICPNCHILLVEANSDSDPDLQAAEDTAVRLGAKYISNSWGECAFPGETAEDPTFDHPGVAVVAASGDNGYDNEFESCDTPSYPAGAPGVTSVGGTSLYKNPGSKRGWAEAAWGGTGSGCDTYEPKPAWQTDTGCAGRTENDVSAVADPNTGVAFYDTVLGTGVAGWSVIGGTSVASPIIASVYALAGTPIPSTTPASYPYADPSALNNITLGSNWFGSPCSPAYLCTARKGYNGPTGLGTPDGTAAFTRPQGTLTGTVTDAATGKPLAGALVQAGPGYARTSKTGHYDLTVPAGSYTVSGLDFAGYATQAQSGVAVAAGQTVTENFTLKPAPDVTLSGTVKDGSGQGWPLYAKISLAGLPVSAYTSPATGRYSLKVPQGSTLTVQASPVYPGYQQQAQQTVSTGSGNATQDLTVPINEALGCAAPGYHIGGTPNLSQTFSKTTIPAGWSLIKPNPYTSWQFNDAAGLRNQTGGTGNFAVAYAPYIVTSPADTAVLQTPNINLSANQDPVLTFDSANNWVTDLPQDQISLSIDGGKTWIQVWRVGYAKGQVTIPLPQAAGQSAVRLRFASHPAGVALGAPFASDTWWELDNVSVVGCVPAPEGLLTGRVSDANTGRGVDGATVASSGAPGQPGTTVPTPGDPHIGGGLYWLPALSGSNQVTASATSYTSAASSVNVTAGQVTQANFTLEAGRLTAAPGSVTATMRMGQSTTASLTVTNTGSAPAQLDVSSQPGGFTQAGPRAAGSQGAARGTGAPVQRVPGRYSPLDTGRRVSAGGRAAARQAPAVVPGAQWTGARSYPVEAGDVATATDPVTGDVYAVGGGPTGGYVLDPHTGLWHSLPAISHQRSGAQAAFIGGRLYVAGGYGFGGAPEPETDVYDVASRIWSGGPAIPHSYYGAGSAVLDGKWYVVGGCDPYYGYCGEDNVQVYDPASGTWTEAAPYPTAISWLSCGAIGSKLYCAGGATLTGNNSTAAYSYDPASNTWSPVASMPVGLWGSGYSVANGQLLVTGGVTDDDKEITNQGYAYDAASNTWTALPNAPLATFRASGACGYYRFGGYYDSNFDPTELNYELPGYGDCGGDSWLSASPASSTLQPGQSEKVTVTLNAAAGSVSQPGVYTAALRVSSDTPYAAPTVPVTLTATPPKSWGELAGTVSAQACGGKTAPLANATVQVTGKDGSQVLTTDWAGGYAQWLDTRGNPFTVIVSAPGEQPQADKVTLRALATTTRNFTLTKAGGCG